jgi:hypothetical protein
VFVFRKYCHWTDSRSRDETGAEPLSQHSHLVELQIGITSATFANTNKPLYVLGGSDFSEGFDFPSGFSLAFSASNTEVDLDALGSRYLGRKDLTFLGEKFLLSKLMMTG